MSVNSLISTATAIESNIAEMGRNVKRTQEQLSKCVIEEEETRSSLTLITDKLSRYVVRMKRLHRELSNELDEEKDVELRSICSPELLNELLKEVDTKKEKAAEEAKKEVRQCIVCYTNGKNTTIIPCSHTFCRQCVVKMINISGGTCAFCRRKIEGMVPVRLTE